MKKHLLLLITLCFSIAVTAQDTPDKSKYNLFSATPDDQMRDLSADRPDFTESAYTVDAGHLQIEADIARLNIAKVGDTMRLTDFSAMNTAFRIGLLNWLEVQFHVEIGHFYRTYDDRPDEYYYQPSYLQEAAMRVKANLIGNDKGDFALAVMPYVFFQTFKPYIDTIISNQRPTDFLPAKDAHPMYGIAVPLSYTISDKWDIAGMVEYQYDEYFSTIAYMAAVNHNVTQRVGLIAEIYNSHTTSNFTSSSESSMETLLNLAFTLRAESNFQFDGGIAFGLQENSGYTPYTGFTVRF